MECPLSNLDVEIEVKVEKRMMGSAFTALVQKLCLQLWNQFCLDSVKTKDSKFVLTVFKIALENRPNQSPSKIGERSGRERSTKKKSKMKAEGIP